MNNKKKYFSLTVAALLIGYSFSSFGSDKKSELSEECKNMCASGGVCASDGCMPDTTISILQGYTGAANGSQTTINKLFAEKNRKINFEYKMMNNQLKYNNQNIYSNRKETHKIYKQMKLEKNNKNKKTIIEQWTKEFLKQGGYRDKKETDIENSIKFLAKIMENSICQIGPIPPEKILKKITDSKQFPQKVKNEFPNIRLEKTKSGKFEVYLKEDNSEDAIEKISLHHYWLSIKKHAEKNTTK